jgi:hypothetical protein
LVAGNGCTYECCPLLSLVLLLLLIIYYEKKKTEIEELRLSLKKERKVNRYSFKVYKIIYRLKELTYGYEEAQAWSNHATKSLRSFGSVR